MRGGEVRNLSSASQFLSPCGHHVEQNLDKHAMVHLSQTASANKINIEHSSTLNLLQPYHAFSGRDKVTKR